MRTNGLSLKPCDRLPPARLIHSGHGQLRIFFAALPGGGKTFFAPLFALGGLARNQTVTRSSGSRAFVSLEGTAALNSLNGACRFFQRRLWTVSPMLKSLSRLGRACSRVRDGPPKSLPHNSCVWRVKAQVWCCVKFRSSTVRQCVERIYTLDRLPICGVNHRHQ